jgi:hypothetical protein
MEPGTEQGTLETTDAVGAPGPGGATDAGAPGAVSGRPERIGVGSGDENVAKIQLAARWAEQFAPREGDSLDAALARFRRAYTYIDSVSKLVDPDTP